MNNAPLTLILIASLGIVAVISLGVFFAVRPRFAGTEEHLAADVSDQQQLYSSELPPPPAPSPTHPASPTAEAVQNPTYSSPDALQSTPPIPSVQFTPAVPALSTADTESPGQQAQLASAAQPVGSSLPHSRPQPGEPTFGQTSKQSGDREVVSTVELLDSLRVAPGLGSEQDFRSTARSASTATPPSTPAKTKNDSESRSTTIRELGLEKEIDMHRYGKVVGIAYQKGRLYVPSYQNGNISVYKAETLDLLKEYSCGGCHIYDVAVLSNGDMILAQGKYSKLTILNSRTGTVVKEKVVPYSTKGVAVSSYDEIFVLSRDKDSIYVCDKNLAELASLPLENKAKTDCNFPAYGADLIYVSCETATLVVDVQGKRVQALKPAQGTYAVGVAVDSEAGDKVFVGQRGKSLVDVNDKNGKYLKAWARTRTLCGRISPPAGSTFTS